MAIAELLGLPITPEWARRRLVNSANASQGFISMTILDTGLVGIGTTNPTRSEKLKSAELERTMAQGGVHGIGDFSSYRSGTIGSIIASLYCSSNVVANSLYRLLRCAHQTHRRPVRRGKRFDDAPSHRSDGLYLHRHHRQRVPESRKKSSLSRWRKSSPRRSARIRTWCRIFTQWRNTKTVGWKTFDDAEERRTRAPDQWEKYDSVHEVLEVKDGARFAQRSSRSAACSPERHSSTGAK